MSDQSLLVGIADTGNAIHGKLPTPNPSLRVAGFLVGVTDEVACRKINPFTRGVTCGVTDDVS